MNELSIAKYDKNDAVMTRGYAILSMCILHLFCRLGSDVYGTPLIWLTPDKPLVYWFGFFAEICVPTYSMCAGYAQRLKDEKGALTFKSNFSKVKVLMLNYWIILGMFSLIGILTGHGGVIPKNVPSFLKSVLLLYSYNGAWWFLNTYIILMLLPAAMIQWPVRKLDSRFGVLICFGIDFVWYILDRFDFLPPIPKLPVVGFAVKEIYNLIDVLPYFWIGGFLCKEKTVEKFSSFLNEKMSEKGQKILLAISMTALIIAINLINKAVLIGPAAVIVFHIFNVYRKPLWLQKVFLCLGNHSTNIWLSHMFFYLVLFRGLVQSAQLPLLMLLFMLLLCLATSFIEGKLEKWIKRLTIRKRNFS